MLEIEGKLDGVEIVYGKGHMEDLKIVVDGQEYYKRLWEISKKNKRKFRPRGFIEMLSYNEIFDKEDFFKKLKDNIGTRVKLSFHELNTSLAYLILDRIHGVKIPKKYNEISDVEYLE